MTEDEGRPGWRDSPDDPPTMTETLRRDEYDRRAPGRSVLPEPTRYPPSGPHPPPSRDGAREARDPSRDLGRGPRRARLAIRRVDPWSVLKFTLIFSLCMLVVFVVAVIVLYAILAALGVFDSVNSFVRGVTDTNSVSSIFSPTKVIGGAALIGGINAVLTTALATLGAFIYNLCADLVGGIEVTLTERS